MSEPQPGVPCSICGGTEHLEILEVKEMMFGLRDRFRYADCSRCRSLLLLNAPDSLERYYPPTYYSFDGATGPSQVPSWCLTMVGGPVLKLMDLMRPRAPEAFETELIQRFVRYYLSGVGISPRSRILDVGCGDGALLRALRKTGFEHLSGVEPHGGPGGEGSDPEILHGDIFDLDPAGEWDLVMFHHSFEHVSDPTAVLDRASRLLSRDGLCLVRVPTVPCHAREEYRECWVGLDAPRHFFIPSPDGLRRLAARAGLVVDRAVYDSTAYQFWASEQYRRDIPLYSPRSVALDPTGSLFSPQQMFQFEIRAAALNRGRQGDQAAFYLRPDRDGR